MLLVLLRHAEAVDYAGSDYERVLTDKGRSQAAKVGAFYAQAGIVPQRILSSDYPRACETARIVADKISSAAQVETVERMGCGMSVDTARDILRDCDDSDCVLMVGHQPDMGEFAGHLLGSPTGSTLAFRKACSAVFDVHSLRCGGAVLQYFIPVRMLHNL